MTGLKIAQTAIKYIGLPYKWGGKTPSFDPIKGVDCSGLTRWLLVNELDYTEEFPHGSYNQYSYALNNDWEIIPVSEALQLDGCALFRRRRIKKFNGEYIKFGINHVGFSYRGYQIEARGRPYSKVMISNGVPDFWDHAFKIKGVGHA